MATESTERGTVIMPWDMFCPGCCNTMDGGMTEDEDEMMREQIKMIGKAYECDCCECIFVVTKSLGYKIIKKANPECTLSYAYRRKNRNCYRK